MYTPTLSVTVTPGNKTLFIFFFEVMWILSGQEEILGGSRSIREQKDEL